MASASPVARSATTIMCLLYRAGTLKVSGNCRSIKSRRSKSARITSCVSSSWRATSLPWYRHSARPPEAGRRTPGKTPAKRATSSMSTGRVTPRSRPWVLANVPSRATSARERGRQRCAVGTRSGYDHSPPARHAVRRPPRPGGPRVGSPGFVCRAAARARPGRGAAGRARRARGQPGRDGRCQWPGTDRGLPRCRCPRRGCRAAEPGAWRRGADRRTRRPASLAPAPRRLGHGRQGRGRG